MITVAATAGLASFTMVFASLSAGRRVWLRRRLAPHLPAGSLERRRLPLLVDTWEHTLERTESALRTKRAWQTLDRHRERAGIALTTAQLAYGSLASAVTLALCIVLLGRPISLALLVAPSTIVVGLWIFMRIGERRRLEAFDEQLPEVLDALASSLKVGHSLTQGLQVVAAEVADPAGSELSRVLDESRLGKPLDASLRDMGDRFRSSDLAFVLTAIGVQRQVGGSLASLLETVATTVRHRRQFARKLKALTSMGRLSARVLMLLPIAVSGLLTALNPSYMTPLFSTSTGRMLVVSCAIMLVSGSLVLRRIVSRGL